jgi:hypothetical protein
MLQGGSGAAVSAGAADAKPVVEHHSNGDEVEAMVEDGVEEELGASSGDGEAKEDDEEEVRFFLDPIFYCFSRVENTNETLNCLSVVFSPFSLMRRGFVLPLS